MAVVYANSWTDIANAALGSIGAGKIDAMTDGNQLARYCNQYLGEVYAGLLASYDWTFAKKRATLAQLLEAPDFGYSYEYQLPVDFERIVSHNMADGFVMEGASILTDAESVELVYVARTEDPTTLPAYFRTALSTALAAQISTALTSNDALLAATWQKAEAALVLARRQDGARHYPGQGETWIDEVR